MEGMRFCDSWCEGLTSSQEPRPARPVIYPNKELEPTEVGYSTGMTMKMHIGKTAQRAIYSKLHK